MPGDDKTKAAQATTAEEIAALDDATAGLDDDTAAMQGTPWYALVGELGEEAERDLMDHWQSYAMSAQQGGADAHTAALDADLMMFEHMNRQASLPLPVGEAPAPPDETSPPADNVT